MLRNSRLDAVWHDGVDYVSDVASNFESLLENYKKPQATAAVHTYVLRTH